MVNRIEKLSLLSQMIAYAKSHGSKKSSTNRFLLNISRQLNISDADFIVLTENPVVYQDLNVYSSRIVLFYRLILLMNLDFENSSKHQTRVYNLGLKMGLRFDTVNRVMDLIGSFPDNVVPTDFLIDLFKAQYN